MCPILETFVDCPTCLTPVCNIEAARWPLCCTPPSFYLVEAAQWRTRKWARSRIDTGLAKSLATMCSDWSSWMTRAEQWTQTKGLSGHLPSIGTRERGVQTINCMVKVQVIKKHEQSGPATRLMGLPLFH